MMKRITYKNPKDLLLLNYQKLKKLDTRRNPLEKINEWKNIEINGKNILEKLIH